MSHTPIMRVGQVVEPNRSLYPSWFGGAADDMGMKYPLCNEKGDPGIIHVPWGTAGIVTEVTSSRLAIVSFPQGPVMTRHSWVTPLEA